MGYLSRVTGNIEIKPVVPHRLMVKLIAEGYAMKPSERYYSGPYCVYVEYDINEEETPDGRLIKYGGWNIEPCTEDSFKAYSLIEDVQNIVKILGPDYRFLGFLEINGEEDTDLWRIRIKDGKVEEVRPTIVWPD